MASVIANREYKTFVAGLITEASPLTFPVNASIDEDNFVLDVTSRKRRLGIDYEQNYTLNSTSLDENLYSAAAVSVHRWDSVNEDPNLKFIVVQIESDLYFYDAQKDDISSNPKNGSNPVTLANRVERTLIQTASISGRLVVAHGAKNLTVLSYDPETDTISVEEHGILVRDIWGVNDGLAVAARPTDLSVEHKYNLVNQGWGGKDTDRGSKHYLDVFQSDSGLFRYPSNADIVSVGVNQANTGVFEPDIVRRTFTGTTPSPKGSMIIDLFHRGITRSFAASAALKKYSIFDPAKGEIHNLLNNYGLSDWGDGISGVHYLLDAGTPSDLTTLRLDYSDTNVTVVTSFNGRICISGMESKIIDGDSRSPLLGGYVLFSQIVTTSENISKFYQEADPTSSEISDIIDSDGGIIRIPEMTKCLRLVALGRSLLVIAENGVWEISGGEVNFSASNYQINKISNIGAVSPDSIVEAEGKVFYWTEGGIYVIEVDQNTLNLTSSNITENTIQSFYNSIPAPALNTARGVYDPREKTVRWLFNSEDDYDGVVTKYRYNRELVFDLRLKAFYPNTFSKTATNSPYVAAYVLIPNLTVLNEDTIVYAGADFVNVGIDRVVITDTIRSSKNSSTKYLAIKPDDVDNKYTFALLRDDSFVDWMSDDNVGADYESYLITGYDLLLSVDEKDLDTQRDKQAKYLTTHFERTETGFVDDGIGNLTEVNPSSCLVSTRWDFSDSTASGKFGTPFQAYRLNRNYLPSGASDLFDYGTVVITTKNKLRGRGRALSLKFSSESGKDLILLGWGLLLSGNKNV